MLQRIQTIFIILAAVTITMLFFWWHNRGLLTLFYTALHSCIAIVAATTLATAFAYKNRKKQITYLIINSLALLITTVALLLTYEHHLKLTANKLHTPIALLTTALILIGLAIKGIKKDERLVNASNRLR